MIRELLKKGLFLTYPPDPDASFGAGLAGLKKIEEESSEQISERIDTFSKTVLRFLLTILVHLRLV